VYDSNLHWQSLLDIQGLKSDLMMPQPLRILVCSASDATLAFLNNMFSGFLVTLVASIQDAEVQLRACSGSSTSLDFIILDVQLESHVADLVHFLDSLQSLTLRDTKLIHLYTPTTSRAGQTVFGRSGTPGVVKMTKPPRKARMLQTLAGLKNLPNTISSGQPTDVTRAMEDLAAAQRTLYGNVLVAEGGYIVTYPWARLMSHQIILLLKILLLNSCRATSSTLSLPVMGKKLWQVCSFSLMGCSTAKVLIVQHGRPTSQDTSALRCLIIVNELLRTLDCFVLTRSVDMPICDGVEAAKRLRMLESKRKSPVVLPSTFMHQALPFIEYKLLLVVALSADCQDSTKQLCLSAGMNAFFSKPLKKSMCMAGVVKD
jgi:CheY-like chemotaxis protein